MIFATSLLRILLQLFFVAQIHGDATTLTMTVDSNYSIAIEDLCHYADDFVYCKTFIERLVEMEEQSRGTTYPYLRRATRRHLDEELKSEERRDFRFYLINVGGATFSISLV